jgi:hypothetical protein
MLIKGIVLAVSLGGFIIDVYSNIFIKNRKICGGLSAFFIFLIHQESRR